MTGNIDQWIASYQDRLLDSMGETPRCCGTCGHSEDIREMEEDSLDTYEVDGHVWCDPRECVTASWHFACERWAER